MADVKWRINAVLAQMSGQPKEDILVRLHEEWEKSSQRLTVEWEQSFERLASVASHGGRATLSLPHNDGPGQLLCPGPFSMSVVVIA